MMMFIEFLCRFVLRELVAWKEIDTLIREFRSLNKFTEEELWEIRVVGYFSGFIHRNQKRANGDKYITHPIEVTRNLVIKLKVYEINAILAALMHDNAEDSGLPSELVLLLIRTLTNGVVATLVLFLSKHIFDQFYIVILQLIRDLRVVIIKIADRNHNLETLEFMPLENQRRKLIETLRYFPPLFMIIREDIMLEKNKGLAGNIGDVENFADRCERIFWESYVKAYKKFLTSGGNPISNNDLLVK